MREGFPSHDSIMAFIPRHHPSLHAGDTDDAGCSQRHQSLRTQNRSIQTNAILLGQDDVGSIVEPTSSLVWADVILTDFQRVISRYLQDINTYLSCTAQRVLRTLFMQKSKPKYACLPSKIVEVWIDRFCVRYDWWRGLRPRCVPGWCTFTTRRWSPWGILQP